jgi:hypothetical protein
MRKLFKILVTSVLLAWATFGHGLTIIPSTSVSGMLRRAASNSLVLFDHAKKHHNILITEQQVNKVSDGVELDMDTDHGTFQEAMQSIITRIGRNKGQLTQ